MNILVRASPKWPLSNSMASFPPSSDVLQEAEALTDREWQVLRLVARGMINKEVGAELSISPLIVKAHLRSILDKLGLRSRVEAAAWAVRHGLLREG